jgi:hypothetical protein
MRVVNACWRYEAFLLKQQARLLGSLTLVKCKQQFFIVHIAAFFDDPHA